MPKLIESKKLIWFFFFFFYSTDDIRRTLWPKILRIKDNELEVNEQLHSIHTLVPDEVYQQITKDVARSGGHLSSDATEIEMEKFHNELTQIICWVLHRHPAMK